MGEKMSQLTIIFSAIIFLSGVAMHLFGMGVSRYLTVKSTGKTGPSEYQKEMLRHGHNYTRALLCLSLLGQIFLDFATLAVGLIWVVRFAFPVGSYFMAISYFLSSCSKSEAKCSCYAGLSRNLGRCILGFAMVALGIGLILTHIKYL